MTRVAYVGNFEPEFSTENDVRVAFESMGVTIIPLQENKATPGAIRDIAMVSDLLLWTGTWDDAQPLDETITTVKMLAQKGIPSACYHLDTFWTSDRGDRRWWLAPMFQMQTVFTADGDSTPLWERMGVDHRWLRPAVRHTACEPGTFNPKYACDVALVGSNGIGYHESVWPYRAELVRQLQAMCARNGWTWRNPGGEPERPDNGKIPRDHRMNDFYASAKVTVGDSLCINREASKYWSDRAYEAPGRYGRLIMPEITRLRDDFDGYMQMYDWGDWQQLEALISSALDDDRTWDFERRLCHEIVMRDHTYVNRCTSILDTMIR